jgi:hypothetical protein
MKYLHIACLQEWLKNRLVTRQTEHSVYYSWKTLKCELCTQTLPSSVTVQGLTYNLLTIDSPGSPFIVLENFKREQTATRKGIHLIKFLDLKPIVLGRGNESNVRISTDISVSRCHASIRFVGCGMLLEDKNSKFGTLLQRAGGVQLSSGCSVSIQVNRTVLRLNNPMVWTFKRLCAKLFCVRSARVRHVSYLGQAESESEEMPHSRSRLPQAVRLIVPEVMAQVSSLLHEEQQPLQMEPLQPHQQSTVRNEVRSLSVKEPTLFSQGEDLRIDSESPGHSAYNSF